MKDEHKDQRFCKRCLQWLPMDHFYQRSKTSPYKHGYCKSCHRHKNVGAQKITCPHCGHYLKLQGVDEKGNIVKKPKAPRRLTIKKKRKDVTQKPLKDIL